MPNVWEKTKFWTRATLFGLCAIYVLIVTLLNWGAHVDGDLNLVFLKYQRPHVLTVLFVTAVLSIFGWWLLRTAIKALRQWRGLQEKSRTTRLEREVAEMRAKAAMLQTRDPATPTPAAPQGFPVQPPRDTTDAE